MRGTSDSEVSKKNRPKMCDKCARLKEMSFGTRPHTHIHQCKHLPSFVLHANWRIHGSAVCVFKWSRVCVCVCECTCKLRCSSYIPFGLAAFVVAAASVWLATVTKERWLAAGWGRSKWTETKIHTCWRLVFFSRAQVSKFILRCWVKRAPLQAHQVKMQFEVWKENKYDKRLKMKKEVDA